MRPIRRVALAAHLLGLSLALAACAGKQEGGGHGPGGAPAVVTTTVLAPSPWRDSLEAIGTATARESVSLTARVSETVADVRFDSGQQVRAGQVLVTLSQRARGRIHPRADRGDRALEGLARERIAARLHRLADGQRRQPALRHREVDLDGGHVVHRGDHRARRDQRAGTDLAQAEHAVERRADDAVAGGGAGGVEPALGGVA